MQENRNGKIWVYNKTPFTNSYENVIKFSNTEEMEKFFTTNSELVNIIYHNNTFNLMKVTNDIFIDGSIEDFETCCYIRFQNNGIMYYGFVLDVIQHNLNCVRLIYEIDVFNTYQIEMFKNKISGNVEQGTLKRKIDNKLNIVNTQQGFNVGQRKIAKIVSFDGQLNNIDWLVFVMRPSTDLGNNDKNKDGVGFVGTFKSFRYFIVPCNLKTGLTIKYQYNNVTYPNVLIEELMSYMVSEFSDKINTVNQVVNVYTTKYCGIPYEYSNGTVYINKISQANVKILGNITIINPEPSVPTEQGGQDESIDYSGGNLTYYGHIFSESMIKRLIAMCRKYKILPTIAICQIYVESFWGDTPVAISDNNWSGMTWYSNNNGFGASGVPITIGTARPISEGGNYIRYQSPEDWLSDYMYLLRPYTSGNGAFYQISGKNNFEDGVKGLFTIGGADYNYATSGYEHYIVLMRDVLNGITNENGGIINGINELVYKNEWVTEDSFNSNKGLDHLKNLLGKTIGNGECYAVAAEYSGIMNGCYLGAGTIYYPIQPKNNGNTQDAYAIGEAYDWESKGWTVNLNPVLADMKIGDIICFQPFTEFSSINGKWGHVEIIRGINGNTIFTYAQNWGGRFVSEQEKIITSTTINWVRSIIHPN